MTDKVYERLRKYIINDDFLTHKKQTILKKNTPDIFKVENKFNIKEKDKLFWCLYIIQNGVIDYKMCRHKRFSIEHEIKIKYIENQKDFRSEIKMNKLITLHNFELGLLNQKPISPNLFLTLCSIENKNIIYAKRNIYFKNYPNDDSDVYIVTETINDNIEIEITTKDNVEVKNITSSKIKTNNVMIPIRGIAYYKLSELQDICEKCNICYINKTTNKSYKKQDLYEQIVQYLS